MRHRRQAGITLIEILIAVSLLSLLSVGVLMAMRIGFNTMDRTDAHMVKNRRVTNSRRIVEDEIQGFIYTQALFHPQPDHPDLLAPVPFLQLDPAAMRFVTAYSLEEAWRGRPQIAVMEVVPGEERKDGKPRGFRLILNETPYTGPLQAGLSVLGLAPTPDSGGAMLTQFSDSALSPRSFILADRLAYCRFSYLEPIPEPPFERWRDHWVQPTVLPLGIRIEMGPLDINTPGELHVTTVTVPMNVTRRLNTTYADRR